MRTTETQRWDAMEALKSPMDMAASLNAAVEVGCLSRVMVALAACPRDAFGGSLRV